MRIQAAAAWACALYANFLVLGVTCFRAGAEVATAAAATVSAGSAVLQTPDAILKALQDRGGTLHDFTADLHYIVQHAHGRGTEDSTGTTAYVKNADGTKFGIHLDKQVIDEGINPADRDIIFNGGWLVDRDNLAKRYTKTQLAAAGSKVDPFKLGEGPLVIPIGQDKDAIEREFDVSVLPLGKDDPANTTHLRMVPHNAATYGFTLVDLYIDSSLEMPIKVMKREPDKTRHTVVLSNVKVNRGEGKILDVEAPKGDGWDVTVTPLGTEN